MRAIHQLVAGYAVGDAISNEARVLRDLFRRWGAASEIYCEPGRVAPELRGDARDLARAAAEIGPDDVVLLHLSIGSAANDLFPRLKGRKAILYHNVTPPQYFRGIRESLAHDLARGLTQVRALAGAASVNLADSAFNAGELRQMGYGEVGVLPLVLDFAALRGEPDPAVLRDYTGDGLINILFVGRGAPNKRIEDLLAAFYFFQRYVEPESRLIHVGSYAGTERYEALLKAKARELGIRNLDIRGTTRPRALTACFKAAHVFLCLSDHEGFCIPLIEAMVHDVPVAAYAAGAVPETLDGAGVLFREKRFDLIAETLGRLVRDPALRAGVIARQRRRLAAYEARDLAGELRTHLAPLL